MKSLVTGATGFVGRHLVAKLAAQGQPVRALYRDRQKGLRYLGVGEEALVGDVCDPAVMKKAVAGVDVVYHCAAAHSTAPVEVIRRTTLPALNFLMAAIRAQRTSPRIILMSSVNVLGNGSYKDASETMPRRQTSELHVDLKIESEKLAEDWIDNGADVVILRPGLIYGPGEAHLPKLARAIRQGKFVFIGSRDNLVPLVYISEMIQALVLAGSVPAAKGRVYHITDGSATTIGQLVHLLAAVLNCAEPKRTLPRMLPRLANSACALIGRNGPVSPSAMRFLGSSRHVDIGRARRELDFEPRVLAGEGVQLMAGWLHESVVAESAA